MFEIILTTTEYLNGVYVSKDVATWHRRYKSRKTAERKAAEMCETVSVKGSPLKYVTVAEVHHVQ
ncbi:TPA: hypothetical protein UZ441_001093 [Escherichia coli]|nr:hypothetical protein [Escherichia coli]HEL8041129.1 hypothetical protein [Escherichia coli]HEL8046683.1 hypothetical protein [Escherichia coli]HEL8050969.1 hypothetical protein [Escherichia coli]HEL8058811.1 hypothetical protein [Escherichia coli]